MGFLRKLFGGRAKQRTLLDEAQEVGGKLVVSAYRRFAVQQGCAPTAKTSDQKIVEIYFMVCETFREAARHKGERIPALNLNSIALHFLQVHEMSGEDFLQEHLQYEVDVYLRSGLRPGYQQELSLL
jgi:uncharacterized protein (UPF0262 family)